MDEIITAIIFPLLHSNKCNMNMVMSSDTKLLNVHILYKIILSMSNGVILKNVNYYEEIIPYQCLSTFRANFRLSRQTFVVILDNIINSHHFQKRNPNFGGREQITPEKALLVSLWTLATPECYRAVADRFNIAKSSVFKCMELIITIILEELCPKFITWPNDAEKLEISQNFEQKYGLPNICGVIDGCHIPIKKPCENGPDYFNRKKFYSMVLQCICRHDLKFIDADIRWPGSVHDGRVLRTSDMYQIGEELCAPDYYLIGDKAYPVKSWLLPPYKNNGHLNVRERYFNEKLSKARVLIENAYALLKGRFRRLRDMLDRSGDQVIARTVIACCVLHNICLLTDDENIEDLINEGRDDRHIPMRDDNNFENDGNAGVLKRIEITNYLWNNRYI